MKPRKKVTGYCEFCHFNLDGDDNGKSHNLCQKIMENKTKYTQISARLSMGYFKQGDDFARNLVNNKKGQIDIIQSLTNYKNQMENVVKQIATLLDALSKEQKADPGLTEKFQVDAGTHHIGIDGPKAIIQKLVRQGVLDLEFYEGEWVGLSDKELEEWDEEHPGYNT